MTATRPGSLPWALFAGWLALLAAAVALIIGTGALAAEPALLGPAIAVDLTLTTALVGWACLVRTGRIRARSLIPVLLIGILAARGLGVLQGDLAVALGALGAAAELGVGLFALSRLRGLRADYRAARSSGEDREAALETALAAHLPSPLLASAAAAEISLLRLGLLGWRERPEAGPGTFTTHRESGWLALAGGLLGLIVVETIGLHVLIARWSDAAAWGMTALSVYSFFWLLGDTQAIRLRPLRVEGGALWLRVGLRWTARIPLDQIAEIEPIVDLEEGEDLDLTLPGAPLLRLRLRAPIAVRGPLGIQREGDRLVIPADDRAGLTAAIRAGQAGA